MGFWDELVESRIQEAMERGEFDNLPGAGRPLRLEEDDWVPEHLRMAYLLLRNAGFLPPELELHRELRRAEDLLRAAPDAQSRARAFRRLEWMRMRLEQFRGRPSNLLMEEDYYQKLAEQLASRRRPGSSTASQEPG